MPIRPGDLVLVPLQARVLPGVVVAVVGETPSFPTRPVEDRVAEDAFVGPLQLTLARWIAAHYRASLFECLAMFLPPGLAARLADAAKKGTWKAPDASPVPADLPDLPAPRPGPPLTLQQESAARRIVAAIDERQHKAFLLHGVTGSGKTHVYFEAVARTLELRRQAIVLVPEIALTPATLARFEERFPGRVAMLHSRLPVKQHRLDWERVRRGEADIVVGSRSALFAPVRRPGLVILDEEHDSSYRQDNNPRYHAREVALWWGQLARAPIVLGSATPDVESYFRAERGRYILLTLPTRYLSSAPRPDSSGDRDVERRSDGTSLTPTGPWIVGARFIAPAPLVAPDAPIAPGAAVAPSSPTGSGAPTAPIASVPRTLSGPTSAPERPNATTDDAVLPVSIAQEQGLGGEGQFSNLPPVTIVDLRAELKAGNTSIFSRELEASLTETLARGEQALLFLNRRGAATCVSCRDCGHVLTCRRCDIPVVFHRTDSVLVCHRCNRRRPVPDRCPACGGTRIRYFGMGTQRVEQELAARFPAARVIRWDHDSTRRKGSYEALWKTFSAGEADVMVGTQMIAKALDFPRVTLVGVVLADVGLFLPDFRAGEWAFQLLSQMAGRSGRSALGGQAIVQTYVPEHYAIRAAAQHDYQAFYDQEIAFRRQHGYPPLGRLVRLLYTASKEERCILETRRMRALLDEEVARQGIADIQVIGPAPCFAERARGRFRWALLLRGDRFARVLDRLEMPLGWTIDVDPVSLL
jgi:primosomal protein N' (replication factor Y)